MTWTADSTVAVFLPTRTVFFPTKFVSLADWTDLFPTLYCLQPTESELRAASLLIRAWTAGLEPDRVRGDCIPCVSTGCTSAVLPYVTCLSSLFSCAPCFSCKLVTLRPPLPSSLLLCLPSHSPCTFRSQRSACPLRSGLIFDGSLQWGHFAAKFFFFPVGLTHTSA